MKLKVIRGIECGERWYGDESDECGVCREWDGGDGHAKKNSPANPPHPSLHPSLHPPNNQSKPIVPTLSPISL